MRRTNKQNGEKRRAQKIFMARNAKPGNQKAPRDWPQMRFGKRDMPEKKENLIKIGEYAHAVEGTQLVVVKLTEAVIPYFSAGIFREGGEKAASVHEVFGKLATGAYCSIKLEGAQAGAGLKAGSEFFADKFKCLSFERVGGAEKAGSGTARNPHIPQGVNRQRSSKYRTRAENVRVLEHAETQVAENRRQYREHRQRFEKKTVEKRGSTVMPKRVTFTDK